MKAEPVEHEGYEVPNWLTKCKDVLTEGPSLGIVALVLLIAAGFAYWNHTRPAYSDTTQTRPDSSVSLPVMESNPYMPAPVPANNLSPEPAPATSDTSNTPSTSPAVPAPATNTTVGPAPTDLTQSLQPTIGNRGGASSAAASGLTGAVTQTTQAAGAATSQLLRSLGL